MFHSPRQWNRRQEPQLWYHHLQKRKTEVCFIQEYAQSLCCVSLYYFLFSCLSDAASGLSDGNEGSSTSGGRHEGRSLKRHQRRSVRSHSRHEKTARAKLNVLNVCSLGPSHSYSLPSFLSLNAFSSK